MMTMCPSPRAFMNGKVARMAYAVPKTFVAIIRCQSAGSASTMLPSISVPALGTVKSILP